MIGHWNSEEDDALQYLPLRAQVIYLRGIRRFADSHGVAGARNRISWKSLSEVAEFRPSKTSNLPKDIPSRKAIRAAIGQLEKAGLIEVLPESARFSGLVFRCLLASKDQSVKIKKGLRGAMEEGPCESGLNAGFSEGRGAMGKTPKTPEEGPASPSPLELPKGSSNTCASTSRFAEFWKAYPLKKGKAEAEKKWKKKKLDRLADQILEDVRNRQERDRRWINGYIPYGSTYVSNEVWRDEIEENPAGASTSAPGRAQPQQHKGRTHENYSRPRNRAERCESDWQRNVDALNRSLAEEAEAELDRRTVDETSCDLRGEVVRLLPRRHG